MSEMRYQVKITAIGEVRDAEGNLLSAEPISVDMELTEPELRQMFEQTPE